MSHYYGIVRGAGKTQATRRGHKTTGLETVAASWSGAVKVEMEHAASRGPNGEDWVEIRLMPWHGQGVGHVLYVGPVNPQSITYSPEDGRLRGNTAPAAELVATPAA